MSTAFHPQTDGQTERANRTFEDMLRSYCEEDQSNWDELLTPLEFAYNNSCQASTGFSPFFLNTGRQPRTPAALQSGVPPDSENPSADAFFTELYSSLAAAKTHLAQAQERQATYADLRRRPVTIKAGDKVLLSTANLKLPGVGPRKLYRRYCGPFFVLEMVGKNAARLKLPEDCRLHPVINVSRLKPYHEDDDYHGIEIFLPPPVALAEDTVAAECFLETRLIGTRQQYLVRWRNSPPEHDSWHDGSELKRTLTKPVFDALVRAMPRG